MPKKIEILVVRDPDGGTDVRLFIDGSETGFTSEIVDAGAGWPRDEWDEATEEIRNFPGYSEAFRTAVLQARQDPPGSKYIGEWG